MQIDLDNLINSLTDLKKTLNQTDAKEFIAAGIQYKIRQNLLQNFQVPRFSNLKGEESSSSEISIENFGYFEFSNGEVMIQYRWPQG